VSFLELLSLPLERRNSFLSSLFRMVPFNINVPVGVNITFVWGGKLDLSSSFARPHTD